MRVRSQFGFTEGPWTVKRAGRSEAMIGRKGWNPDDPSQCGLAVYGARRIATIAEPLPDPEDISEMDANARLVASSPDMLAALLDTRAVLTRPGYVRSSIESELLAKVSGVIERALERSV